MKIRFKDIISRGLVLGILLNNLNYSFAGTLDNSGRYESFEGSDITVNNILEDDVIDVEVEGNTMVNVLDTSKIIANNGWSYNYDAKVGYINKSIVTSTDWCELNFNTIKNIEANKEYTVYFNITKNTLSREAGSSNPRVAKVSISSDTLDSDYFFVTLGETGIKKVVITPSSNTSRKPYISISPGITSGEFEFKDFMVIEGNHIDKDLEFFEGIKSVGELEGNNLELKSETKNLIKLKSEPVSMYGVTITPLEDGIIEIDGATSGNQGWIQIGSEISKLYKNKEYTYQYGYVSGSYNGGGVGYYIKDRDDAYHKNSILYSIVTDIREGSSNFYKNNKVVLNRENNIEKDVNGLLYIYVNPNTTFDNYRFKVQLEEGTQATDYQPYKTSKRALNLSEPLRGLPNGIRDRIIKKNGQWVIERNIGEIIFDGSDDEGWFLNTENTNPDNLLFSRTEHINMHYSGYDNLFANRFNSIESVYRNDIYTEGIDIAGNDAWGYKNIHIKIKLNKLSSPDLSGFKKWLQSNNVITLYRLDKPIYEPLNIDLNLPLYLDTTYITTNSTIPAILKTTVDRTINRATEAIALANSNPTLENISQARYWSNLMKETIKKDELQGQIDDITATDIKVDKKKISANVDVYVKSENTLTMSLDTNYILFDGYNGVDSLERNQALSITVNSSLPYDLNAYIPEGIVNKDNIQSIPVSALSLKDSSDMNYKAFVNTSDKIVLKSNCDAGADNIHKIDFKLASSQTHKADVYKTVVRFEAEQR